MSRRSIATPTERPNLRTLGDWRILRGLTQQELALMAGVKDRSEICRMELGRVQPLACRFLRICAALQIDPREVDTSLWEAAP